MGTLSGCGCNDVEQDIEDASIDIDEDATDVEDITDAVMLDVFVLDCIIGDVEEYASGDIHFEFRNGSAVACADFRSSR